ncbi:hypothetical protein L9F63_014614 [Diploptera punctata]|uniref:Cyclin A n=1 Tax=Diploptera punctata TaxID=6984 RepID=A0AAD8A7V0_DIPPU|nr:hypothetical protein L9F63_014614 [Diploptera punctata]
MATFRIHKDQENRVAEIKLRNKDVQPQQKRAVLGVLNKIPTNAQPSKAKLIFKSENVTQKVFAAPAVQKAPFKIHEDKSEEEITVKDCKQSSVAVNEKNKETPLPSAIISLHRPPLAILKDSVEQISEDEQDEGSPMSLDKSAILTPDKHEPEKSLSLLMLDVDEYREDVYLYLREAESRHRPKFGYMRKQPDITFSMRSILVDWLVEVAEEYKLQTETLYLAVSYIDRFLSYMSVVRAKLQLVGTAAMFIASKYEEIYPPDVKEFVYITDDTYSKKQVLRMEHLILKVLAFDLSVPTPLSFITVYSVSCSLSNTIMYLAMYLCELSLLEADPYLQYLPSELAASAIAVARHTLELDAWTDEMNTATGYSLDDLGRCICHLNVTYSNASTHPQQAIREKYKGNRWQNVSLLTPRTPSLLV